MLFETLSKLIKKKRKVGFTHYYRKADYKSMVCTTLRWSAYRIPINKPKYLVLMRWDKEKLGDFLCVSAFTTYMLFLWLGSGVFVSHALTHLCLCRIPSWWFSLYRAVARCTCRSRLPAYCAARGSTWSLQSLSSCSSTKMSTSFIHTQRSHIYHHGAIHIQVGFLFPSCSLSVF